ncbi:MAG: hypothetical protein ABIL09_02990 [Gemmatimonadota bacterium]
MKSALELAMERTESMVDKEAARLTPEQLAAIDQIKKEYEAKWAEQEIAAKGRMQQIARDDPQAFAEHRRQFEGEMSQLREKIFAERDARIEAARQAGKSR